MYLDIFVIRYVSGDRFGTFFKTIIILASVHQLQGSDDMVLAIIVCVTVLKSTSV